MIKSHAESISSHKVDDNNFKSLRMRRSFVKLSGLVKSVTKMVTRCLRMTSDKNVVYV